MLESNSSKGAPDHNDSRIFNNNTSSIISLSATSVLSTADSDGLSRGASSVATVPPHYSCSPLATVMLMMNSAQEINDTVTCRKL